MVAQLYNPSTKEAEVEELEIQKQPWLPSVCHKEQ